MGGSYTLLFGGEVIHKEEFSIDLLESSKPWLAPITLDSLIWHGRWPIIDNYVDNINEIPKPYFKLLDHGAYKVVDMNLEPVRNAHDTDLEQLMNRTTRAPIGIQKIVQAKFGYGEWDPDDDRFLFDYVLKSSALALGA
jgi:hypothetical protein